jgi:SOS-response transcriptional repressor LexA
MKHLEVTMSNNKQQTIVQWIRHQIKQQGVSHYFTTREILDRAEQMENEQRKKIWDEALKSVEKKLELLKETYGGNK